MTEEELPPLKFAPIDYERSPGHFALCHVCGEPAVAEASFGCTITGNGAGVAVLQVDGFPGPDTFSRSAPPEVAKGWRGYAAYTCADENHAARLLEHVERIRQG